MRAISHTYDILKEYRVKITYVLLGSCFFLTFLYVLNVYKVISDTVSLQRMESEVTVLQGKVNELDAEYLALSSKVTPDKLSMYGMRQGKVSEYITKSSSLTRVVSIGHGL